MTLSRCAAAVLAVVLGFAAVPPAAADPVRADFGGILFADRNANGVRDAGEGGLADATVMITGGASYGQYNRTTDATGRFSFTDIPTGYYKVSYGPPVPWTVEVHAGGPFDFILVDSAGKSADIRVPAVKEPLKTRDASLWFDRDTYQPGDTARIKVVLSNTSAVDFTGVTATCSPGENAVGLGTGALAAGGPGIAIPAHSTRIVDVTEVVPAASARWGYVAASCAFTAVGDPSWARAEKIARVPGVRTSQSGTIYQERGGEGVAGVTVVITDPTTGAEVARARTNESGGFEVRDVPAGIYDLRVAGPWKSADNLGRFEFRVVEGESGNRFAVVPGSEQESKRPKLVATAAFAEPGYNSGDRMHVRISVRNIGDAAADEVRIAFGRGTNVTSFGGTAGDFEESGPGVRLEPGVSRELDVIVIATDANAGVVVVNGYFESLGSGIGMWNNEFHAIAGLTATRGTFAGILYADKNGNGALDPGEGMSRTPIQLTGGVPESMFIELTDTNGRFAFRDIPTGHYSVKYFLPDIWTVYDREYDVDEQDHGEVLVRAVPSLVTTLTASINFTKGSYAPGETAHLTVKLTNRSRGTIAGLTAWCVGVGWGYELDNTGPGWGPLRVDAPGVTLAAGATRTLDVWSVVPDAAFTYGYVTVTCTFGNPPGNEADPWVTTKAMVPGGIGSASGRLIYDRNADSDYARDEGVPNTKVVLIDEDSGRVMARSITDASGHFVFRNLPANNYEFRVIGPWKVVDLDKHLQIMAGETDDTFDKLVVPGAIQPDPDAVPGRDPVPQAGVAPPAARRLATTGASVLELSAVGLVALALGLAMVLVFARRRRRA